MKQSAADHAATILDAPCPCDECPLARRCGAELVCCKAFGRYVSHGTRWQELSREPSLAIFVQTYPTTDAPRRPQKPRKRRAPRPRAVPTLAQAAAV